MNPITYLVGQFVVFRLAVDGWIETRSTPENEEGSHTADVIMWAVGVVVLVGIAMLAITAFITAEAAKLR